MFAFFVLAVLALLFVVAPALLRKTGSDAQKHLEQAEANIRAWYEERLQAVEQDVLEEEDKTQLTDELAAVLLAEYPQANGKEKPKDLTPTFRKSCNVLLSSGALLIALAMVIYIQVGSYGAAKIQGAQAILALSPEDDSAKLQSWRIVLSDWLVDQPEDAPSWYLLGHAHLKLGEFDQAERAFAQAYEFNGSDMLVKLYWLQSRYLSQQGVMDALSKQLAEEILMVNPNNQQVLEMLAVAAIAEGDAASAITMLNRTLNTVVQPDRVRATVDAIEALRASDTLLTNAKALRVEVYIADGVKANPRDTVFVVARPVGGGMPYAVVRRPGWLLPFTVTLDDLVSMSPARPLSQADNVEVVVRLSAAGAAEASADDWRWLSEPISVAIADREQPSPLRQNLKAVLSPPD